MACRLSCDKSESPVLYCKFIIRGALPNSWLESGRGRAGEMATGGRTNASLLCFGGAGGRGYPKQELYICRNRSATTSPNGDLLNPDLFSLLLISNYYLLGTREGTSNYPCFYDGLCKGRNSIFDLLCVKQILSSVLLTFSFVMGHPTSRNESNTLMLGRLGWRN